MITLPSSIKTWFTVGWSERMFSILITWFKIIKGQKTTAKFQQEKNIWFSQKLSTYIEPSQTCYTPNKYLTQNTAFFTNKPGFTIVIKTDVLKTHPLKVTFLIRPIKSVALTSEPGGSSISFRKAFQALG